MQKILIIHPFLPFPLTGGGQQALFNGIKAIKDDMKITLVYEAIDNDAHKRAQQEFLKEIPDVEMKPLLCKPSPKTVKNRIKNLYNKVKNRFWQENKEVTSWRNLSQWWKYTITPSNPQWTEHIYKVSREEDFDIIQIEMPWRLSDVYAMPQNAKLIYVHHELGFVRRELELKSFERNSYMQVCKLFADRNEIQELNLYNAVIALSTIDSKKLVDAGVFVPVYSSFAIVDSNLKDVRPYAGNGKHLVFVGPESHTPNLVGIVWFLDNCWEKLRKVDQDYTLDIIGNWSSERREEFSRRYSNVNFLGFVDDLYASIKDHVMIVPITIGSGIRMKILEACNFGIPFVSTTIGAEGIPVENEKHCFLADSPDSFVNCLIKLKNNNLALNFCRNAHRLIEDNFSVEALRKNRLEIYKMVDV